MTAATPTGDSVSAPSVCNSDEAQLEADIEAAKQRMCAAPERDEKLREWREMCRLIDQRSPHRVRFMERMAGLA